MVHSPTTRGPEPGRAPWTVTTWDLREGARATTFALLGMVLVWLVTAATDEGGLGWATRAARVLPLAPACAACGTWLGQARGWARGEGRVLALLGRSPFATSAAAIAGGVVVAWGAALAMALVSQVDVAAFFPTARGPEVFVPLGGGVFENEATGLLVRADGTFGPAREARSARSPSPSVPPLGRAAAALASALAGAGLPLLFARTARGSRVERGAVVVVSASASILLFHAVAAGLLGAMVAVLPSLILLVWAAARASGLTPVRS